MSQFLVIVLGFLFLVQPVFAQQLQRAKTSSYQIPSDVISSGGGDKAHSTNYLLDDTIGESNIGFGRSDNFDLNAGYRQPYDGVYLALGCDDVADMGTIVFTGQATVDANCNVNTDNQAGYSLAWSVSSGSGGTNTGHLISTTAPHTSTIPPFDAGTTGLVAYWKLDETSGGSTVLDASGNGNTGTPNGASGANNKPQPSTTLPSNMNFADLRSLDFDGTDDYVSFGDKNAFTLTNATFSAWVRFDTLNGNHRIFLAKRDAANTATEYQFGINASNRLKLSFPSSGTTCCSDITETATTLSTGTWYHVAVTFDDAANQVKWYVNGVNTQTDNTALSFGSNTSTILTMGATNEGAAEYFDGLLNDVRVYNVALTAAQVQALYNTPHTWSVSNIQSAWGARLRSSSTDTDSKWGTDSSSEKWLNIGDGSYSVVSRSTRTGVSGSSEIFQFRTEVGANKIQPSGLYRTTATFTASSL